MRSYHINNELHLTTYIYIEPCRELFFEGRGYEIGNTHARDGIFLYYTCFFQFGKAKVYVNEENDDDDGGFC